MPALLAIALALAFLSSTDDTPCQLPEFRPALESPRPGDIFIQFGDATCDSLEINVAAQEMSGLFTLSFDLAYPTSLLKYEGYTLGPLLKKGPPRTSPVVLIQAGPPGRIGMTMTRFAPDGSVAAVGAETLVTLRFTRLAKGVGEVAFDLDAASAVPERVLDDRGAAVAARFGPAHGGSVVLN